MNAGRDGRSVHIEVAQALPLIMIDMEMMQLALRQLFDNAVKYSAAGSCITIRAGVSGSNLELAVHNWGEPLSGGEKDRVFEKFYRGANARHHVLGTGMGLTIAREVLLAHGGDIAVQSSEHCGTQFLMSFPIHANGLCHELRQNSHC
jgi:K+-sensing histidine kinase KdpD